MKKLTLVTLTAFLCFFSMKAQLRMDCDGDVGIGLSYDPYYKLQLRGNAFFDPPSANCGFYFTNYSTAPIIQPEWAYYAYLGDSYKRFLHVYTYNLHYSNIYQDSDISIKENIRSIEDPLSKICNIRGLMFDYKPDYFKDSPDERKEMLIEGGKNQIGVIAQELKEVVPELVIFNEESDLYEVNMVGLIPILVEALKEQQTIIDNVINEISELKSESSNNLKSALISTDNNLSEQTDKPILFQNMPNPFTENTQIEYYISENVNLANVYIYNMSGTQLKSIPLFQKGNGSIIINGGEFDAGMYIYALIADGRVIDTKQMILTD